MRRRGSARISGLSSWGKLHREGDSLGCDLAAIYGVKTGRRNEAVKRNVDRFPGDFMFQLSRDEAERSRSQIAILKIGATT